MIEVNGALPTGRYDLVAQEIPKSRQKDTHHEVIHVFSVSRVSAPHGLVRPFDGPSPPGGTRCPRGRRAAQGLVSDSGERDQTLLSGTVQLRVAVEQKA